MSYREQFFFLLNRWSYSICLHNRIKCGYSKWAWYTPERFVPMCEDPKEFGVSAQKIFHVMCITQCFYMYPLPTVLSAYAAWACSFWPNIQVVCVSERTPGCGEWQPRQVDVESDSVTHISRTRWHLTPSPPATTAPHLSSGGTHRVDGVQNELPERPLQHLWNRTTMKE